MGSFHGLGAMRVTIITGAPGCVGMRRGVTGAINELSLGTFQTGSTYYSYDAQGDVCSPPGFYVDDNHRASRPDAASRLPDFTAETANIVISDGNTEWRAEFQSVCAARSVTLASPATGSVRAGDPVVLQWSPATDLVSPDMLLVRKEGAEEIVDRVYRLTVEGTTVKFVMPALEAEGRYTFEPIGVVPFRAGVARCDGPVVCDAQCTDIKVAPATVDFAL
ncbi:hypothetical protein [Archangium lansingense]|uniref:Lipoprotein n=1 Tax=Archangium lansingense TaxID=2995310 RepID=A0ABT3ZU91_9BACT|nr:hypothetical protein [Archangium lansinium]MCY1072965.1 hypothetical protein [Archangium lansinium]